VDLPDTSAGRDVSALSKRKDLRYSSFAFRTIEDSWGITEQGFPLRTLLQVLLLDVAPVNSPAYLDSSTGVRSLAEHLNIEVDVVTHATTEELRSLLLGEHIDIPAVEGRSDEAKEIEEAQGDTHVPISIRQRELDLLKLR
jgi:hypothetical protein